MLLALICDWLLRAPLLLNLYEHVCQSVGFQNTSTQARASLAVGKWDQAVASRGPWSRVSRVGQAPVGNHKYELLKFNFVEGRQQARHKRRVCPLDGDVLCLPSSCHVAANRHPLYPTRPPFYIYSAVGLRQCRARHHPASELMHCEELGCPPSANFASLSKPERWFECTLPWAGSGLREMK